MSLTRELTVIISLSGYATVDLPMVFQPFLFARVTRDAETKFGVPNFSLQLRPADELANLDSSDGSAAICGRSWIAFSNLSSSRFGCVCWGFKDHRETTDALNHDVTFAWPRLCSNSNKSPSQCQLATVGDIICLNRNAEHHDRTWNFLTLRARRGCPVLAMHWQGTTTSPVTCLLWSRYIGRLFPGKALLAPQKIIRLPTVSGVHPILKMVPSTR